jgi:hypothetical protein
MNEYLLKMTIVGIRGHVQEASELVGFTVGALEKISCFNLNTYVVQIVCFILDRLVGL